MSFLYDSHGLLQVFSWQNISQTKEYSSFGSILHCIKPLTYLDQVMLVGIYTERDEPETLVTDGKPQLLSPVSCVSG